MKNASTPSSSLALITTGIACPDRYAHLRRYASGIYFTYSIEQEIAKRFDRIEGLIGRVSTTVDLSSTTVDKMSNRVDGLTTTVDGLTTTVDGTSNRVDGLTTTVDGLSTTVDGLSKKVDALSATIDDLAATTAENFAKMATKEDLAEVEEKLTAKIDGVKRAVDEGFKRHSALEARVSKVETELHL